mgnify:CR=1 FL=1
MTFTVNHSSAPFLATACACLHKKTALPARAAIINEKRASPQTGMQNFSSSKRRQKATGLTEQMHIAVRLKAERNGNHCLQTATPQAIENVFGIQNGRFCRAKQPVRECKAGCFSTQGGMTHNTLTDKTLRETKETTKQFYNTPTQNNNGPQRRTGMERKLTASANCHNRQDKPQSPKRVQLN